MRKLAFSTSPPRHALTKYLVQARKASRQFSMAWVLASINSTLFPIHRRQRSWTQPDFRNKPPLRPTSKPPASLPTTASVARPHPPATRRRTTRRRPPSPPPLSRPSSRRAPLPHWRRGAGTREPRRRTRSTRTGRTGDSAAPAPAGPVCIHLYISREAEPLCGPARPPPATVNRSE